MSKGSLLYGVIVFLLFKTDIVVTGNVTNFHRFDYNDSLYAYDDEYLFGDRSGDSENTTVPTDDEDQEEDNFDPFDGEYPDNEKTREILGAGSKINERDEWEGFDGLICGNGLRIGRSKRCNGRVDCFDCSDELNCPNASQHIFMCYEQGFAMKFNHKNPKCIPLGQFCDGVKDCKNGADERRSGVGFRCPVKNRFRECILPQRYVYDSTVHCEDGSDEAAQMWNIREPFYHNERNGLLPEGLRSKNVPVGFFSCLNGDLLISLTQVCNGKFDCSDLSDECLCEVGGSAIVTEVCGGLCAKSLWSGEPINSNCDHCEEGEIYRKPAISNNTADAFPWLIAVDVVGGGIIRINTGQMSKKKCFTPKDMMEHLISLDEAIAESRDFEVIECLSQSFPDPIRARKCDDRPECLFGEDECGIGCDNAESSSSGITPDESGESGESGDSLYNTAFCRLLTTNDNGFACRSWMNEDGSGNHSLSHKELFYFPDRISVCDGKVDCPDASDEMFCPKRMPCSSNSNNTISATYDESQRCDGFSHCPNGEDEDPTICSDSLYSFFRCDVPSFTGEQAEIFHSNSLLDGVQDCKNGADECPPFFSKIKEVRNMVYGDLNGTQQIGISTHQMSIDYVPLQIFEVAVGLLGLSALTVSLALGFYNLTIPWIRFCKSGPKDRKIWIRSCLIYTREVVVSIGFTVSKAILCSYFVYTRMRRPGEVNYSTKDLKWRSSWSCNLAGLFVLMGSQIPIFTLAIFAIVYTSLSSLCGKWMKNKKSRMRTGNARSEGKVSQNQVSPAMTKKDRRVYNFLMALGCVTLILLIWLPIALLVDFLLTPSTLHLKTQTYGWVLSKAVPTFFKVNLISQKTAEAFASKLVALAENSSSSSHALTSTVFSFPDFVKVTNEISNGLDVETLGTFGYFSHSGACLPAFLVHVTGGEAPFDIAVSNPTTVSLSVIIVATDFILIFCTAVLASRYGAGLSKACSGGSFYEKKQRHFILDHTFCRFVLIEAVTWFPIVIIFMLKAVVPDIASDRTYTALCIIMLGLNCGLFTPFALLARKFRVGKPSKNTSNRWSRRRPDNSTRIIELQETNEEASNLLKTKEKVSPQTQSGETEKQSFLPENGDSGHESSS